MYMFIIFFLLYFLVFFLILDWIKKRNKLELYQAPWVNSSAQNRLYYYCLLKILAWDVIIRLNSIWIGLYLLNNDIWGWLGLSVLIGERWNSWTLERRSRAKAFSQSIPFDQERKLRDRRWLDTVVVLTVNYGNSQLGFCYFYHTNSSGGREIFKCLPSGGSMVARLKLKGIDGRAPQRSGACGLIWLNTGNLTKSRHNYDWQTEALS